MDNLTHSLVGLVAAKAGLERVSPYATAVCIIAANAPDADIVASLGGSWFYLHHHRGITHSIVGTLALAFVIPLLFYVVDRIVARMRHRPGAARFRGLLFASLLLSASHPLLDWTNNYGVRPLLPFDGRWFYGDLVFILDPFLWLTLGGAAFLLTAKTRWRTILWAILGSVITAAILYLPARAGMNYPLASRLLWLAGVIGLVVAYRAGLAARLKSSIAVVALLMVIVYWGTLSLAHARALVLGQEIARGFAEERGERVLSVAAMPLLADPLSWSCVSETDAGFYRYVVSLEMTNRSGRGFGETRRYEKPSGADAEFISRASEDERAQIFLNFARFPYARVQTNCFEGVLVQFADLRYTEPGAARRGGNFSLDVPVTQ
jgi:inner membrane protein